MTLLVGWTGIDSRGPASVYIATDSRVSWGSQDYFDHANKTFALREFPAVIGYCGDSLASHMLISQAIALVEALPVSCSTSLEGIVNVLIRLIIRNYDKYPKQLSTGDFTIVVGGKSKVDSSGEFEFFRIDSAFEGIPKKSKLSLPEKSGPVVIAGSGRSRFEELYKANQSSANPNKSTSRDVFHSFFHTLRVCESPVIGSIPQIVRVIRKPYTGGTYCGVVADSKRYISGQLVDRDIAPKDMPWFNDNFEVTDAETALRKPGAQVQLSYQLRS